MINLTLEEALDKTTKLVDERIDELLPDNDDFKESRLVEAMRYSALAKGKRIRPFLAIASANIFKVDTQMMLNIAAAIEFIHVYSLIHDDLPAMDDDDYRRGILSCHKNFDEATAILAGDSLLTYAFEILSDPRTNRDAYVRCELINVITRSIGFNGMAGGQMIDLESNNSKLSAAQIARLQRLKTGEMFMAAVDAGSIVGKALPELRKALLRYAHDIGLAFQIRDDILDHQTDGKNKDDGSSIVNAIGLDNATEQLKLLRDQAISHLQPLGFKANLLKDLAEFIVIRQR